MARVYSPPVVYATWGWGMGLVGEVDRILVQFRPVFSRRAAFGWFVIVVWAFMLRLEAFGVTSIVRCFGLAPTEYYNLLHFFHSASFSVCVLCCKWNEIVKQSTQSVVIGGLRLFLVDGIKAGKAGRKMPGVKLLHQESSNNTKAEHIMGHYWGAVSSVVVAGLHYLALPLRFQIQDGLKRSPSEAASLIDKMASLVIETLGTAAGLVVGDAYFSSTGFILALRAADLHYVGRMRSNVVAYEPAKPRTGPPRRGRPAKYGRRIKLRELFEQPKIFQPARVDLYGELRHVRYYCADLLWHGLWLRFVLSIYADGRRRILVSSNRRLTPEDILYAYGLRFKIEVSFKVFVQILCGFCYHFWLKAMVKRQRGDGDQYLHRAGEEFREQVFRKIEAYERFVNISAIGLGILQMLAIRFPKQVWECFPLWLRTYPKHACPSENVVRLTLQQELHRISLETNRGLLIENILATKHTADADADHPMRLVAGAPSG